MLFRTSPSFADNDLPAIIRACRAHDGRAQRTLFKQFFGYAKSICLRYTSSTEEAEDVLNEGFLKAFQHLDSFDDNLPFKAWLRTIMVNTAISHYRKNQRHQQQTSLDTAEPVAVDTDVIDQMAAEEILVLVQKLTPTYRTVFMMHVVDGYSLHEIAGLLDHNEATVRSNFARARAKLQDMIRLHYPACVPAGGLTKNATL